MDPANQDLHGLRMVVDPGHGGFDTGSVGGEVDWTLAVATELAARCQAMGADVLPTRSENCSRRLQAVVVYNRTADGMDIPTFTLKTRPANTLQIPGPSAPERSQELPHRCRNSHLLDEHSFHG